MRPSRMMAAALVAGGMGIVYAGSAHAEAESNCVTVNEIHHEDTRSLEVKLANDCPRTMSCGVDFTITCGKESRVDRQRADLASAKDKSFVGSADACKQEWSLSASWRCTPS